MITEKVAMDLFEPPSCIRIGIIGLGYVGLPLAIAFARQHEVVGFDISHHRISDLRLGHDATGEVSSSDLAQASKVVFTDHPGDLEDCTVYIVAVPTPVDHLKRPNLQPLLDASRTISHFIRQGNVVIFESTVYPGATEEDCIPVIERISGLQCNHDFFAGYSPERINPGDKNRPITDIVKVTSGSTPKTADFVDRLYASIVKVGTYKASSIKVAEAAKIVENTQRDVNIALMNELSILFSYLGIDTNEVLNAAASKWNFIHLKPGLVGGHCIGVDPHYLIHKASSSGFIPDIIRTAREINDNMPRHAASLLVKAMIQRDLQVKGARVLVIGFTFKENCPDTRNTKSMDLYCQFRSYGMAVDLFDSLADSEEVLRDYGVFLLKSLSSSPAYDAIVLAVPHSDIIRQGALPLRKLLRRNGILFDMKAIFPLDQSDLRL